MKRIAKFEKVSFEQFKRDVLNTLDFILEDEVQGLYDTITLPVRATKHSAGHDFVSPISFVLSPNKSINIPTGIRCKMDYDYVMLISPRSSLGIKKGLFILNTIPVIDADYYNAKNEGHIFICIKNNGNELLKLEQNESITQAIFVPYGVADDKDVITEREGGIGSTSK